MVSTFLGSSLTQTPAGGKTLPATWSPAFSSRLSSSSLHSTLDSNRDLAQRISSSLHCLKRVHVAAMVPPPLTDDWLPVSDDQTWDSWSATLDSKDRSPSTLTSSHHTPPEGLAHLFPFLPRLSWLHCSSRAFLVLSFERISVLSPKTIGAQFQSHHSPRIQCQLRPGPLLGHQMRGGIRFTSRTWATRSWQGALEACRFSSLVA